MQNQVHFYLQTKIQSDKNFQLQQQDNTLNDEKYNQNCAKFAYFKQQNISGKN